MDETRREAVVVQYWDFFVVYYSLWIIWDGHIPSLVGLAHDNGPKYVMECLPYFTLFYLSVQII